MRPAAAAAAVLVLLAAAGCTPDAPEPAPAGKPESRFSGVEVVEQDPDGTLWRLTAREGRGRELERTGALRGVRVSLERGDGRIDLEADEASVEGGERVVLGGGVVVSWDGRTARTDTAVYERGSGRVRSYGPVLLEGRGLTVRGTGLEVDVDGRTAWVGGRVRAVLRGAAP